MFNILEQKIKHMKNLSDKDNINLEEFKWFVHKAIRGGEYLISVFKQMDESIKLNFSSKSVDQFSNQIIKDIKHLDNKLAPSYKLSKFKSEIECDHPLIHKIITGIVRDTMNRNSSSSSAIDIELSVFSDNNSI